MSKQPETLFKEKVAKKLKLIPRSYFFKVQLKALRGIPDYVGCVNGRCVVIELKVKKNKTSVLQSYVLNCFKRAGALAYTAYPHNIDDILKDIQILTTGETYGSSTQTGLVPKC